jgi:hypothetical protein
LTLDQGWKNSDPGLKNSDPELKNSDPGLKSSDPDLKIQSRFKHPGSATLLARENPPHFWFNTLKLLHSSGSETGVAETKTVGILCVEPRPGSGLTPRSRSIFHFNEDPDPTLVQILLLINVMQIFNPFSTDPPGLHFKPPRLHFERPRSPRLHFERLKPLYFLLKCGSVSSLSFF